MIFTKKWFLFSLIIIFLVAVFMDQNTFFIPLKLFIGGPVHVHLSLVIAASMLAGAVLALAGVFLVQQFRAKIKKKREMELQ